MTKMFLHVSIVSNQNLSLSSVPRTTTKKAQIPINLKNLVKLRKIAVKPLKT